MCRDHSPLTEFREYFAGARSREDLSPECERLLSHIEDGADSQETKHEVEDLEQSFWKETQDELRKMRKAS